MWSIGVVCGDVQARVVRQAAWLDPFEDGCNLMGRPWSIANIRTKNWINIRRRRVKWATLR
jgi:hypothetical protein